MSTFGRVKAVFTRGGRDDHREYECKTCGARFALRRQVCPDCGGYTLDRLDWSADAF